MRSSEPSLPPIADVVRFGSSSPEANGWRRSVERSSSMLGELLDHPPGLHLTPSCTHALEAAAELVGVAPLDEVVVPAYSFPSTANPFVLRGARLRFADVDLATGNVEPNEIERCITERTSAVVCMHYGGVACDLDRIEEICASRGVPFIEDAAHGLFASFRGVPLGRFGAFGALSFHRTKNVSSFDGGALVVNRSIDVARADAAVDKGTNRAAFDRGDVGEYDWVAPGSAGRLADPLASLLEHDLDSAPSRQIRRHRIWSHYLEHLTPWADDVGAGLATVSEHREHSAHLFWLRLPVGIDRGRFVTHCASRGVETVRHFGSLPHSPYGRSIAHPDDSCPNARTLGDRLVRLPLRHDLSDADVDRVVGAVLSFGGS